MKNNFKITEEDKEKIKERLLNGETYKSIGDSYNVTKQRIGIIVKQLGLQRITIQIRKQKRASDAGFDSIDEYEEFIEKEKLKLFIERCSKKKKSML